MAAIGSVERIVLIGMMGSGKSTVGRLLADRLGWRYMDNDLEVRAITQQEPPEVMATAGEASLHEAEAAALLEALTFGEPMVISAAAWVVLHPVCEAAIQREDVVVYLRAQPGTLHQRIGHGVGRRRDATDLAWLEQRCSERDELYQQLAGMTIDVDELRPDEVAMLVLDAVDARGAPH